jgi:hydrogenase-4 component B
VQSIPLSIILVTVAILFGSALAAAASARSNRVALVAGSAGALLGSALGLAGALHALLSNAQVDQALPWALALGSLRLGIDPLSAFFLCCIFVVSGLAALYGIGYLRGYHESRRLWPALVAFNLLEAAMVLVVLARDGVCFLLAWEVMSIASFFLVTFESERDDVRRAGTTYLIASHIGVLILFALFSLLSRGASSLAFADLARASALGGGSLCFILALVGFGTKAGFWPVHFWLPDAHPAAPSHVSAVMSGVMIKMGIYGLLRVLSFLGTPPAWWGALLIVVGATSGIAGVLHALAQHDLKRLLAYHSVENIGIIALGIGIGMLGRCFGNATVATLGYAGALLHVLNHGLFKGLLFQGAGSVLHATGTRDMGSLGGLLRRMPLTGGTFLVGAAAISGLPPLNGFASELLIYLGAFHGAGELPKVAGAAAVVVLPALALIGGLAAACFVKAFGVVFLGEPRTTLPGQAHEAAGAMRASMVAGAVLCLAIGVWPAGAVGLVATAAGDLGGAPMTTSLGPLFGISLAATVLVALIAVLAAVRARLLRSRPVEQAATWGCGYAHPSPRMQYTAMSFADPVLMPFASALRIRTQGGPPEGLFPTAAHYEKHVGDMAGERVLVPAWRRFLHTALRLKAIQHGRMQLYLVYMLVTLVGLLLWQLGGALGG